MENFFRYVKSKWKTLHRVKIITNIKINLTLKYILFLLKHLNEKITFHEFIILHFLFLSSALLL